MIYMNDLLFDPQISFRLGEIIMQRTLELQPDYIMTVEAKGSPWLWPPPVPSTSPW